MKSRSIRVTGYNLCVRAATRLGSRVARPLAYDPNEWAAFVSDLGFPAPRGAAIIVVLAHRYARDNAQRMEIVGRASRILANSPNGTSLRKSLCVNKHEFSGGIGATIADHISVPWRFGLNLPPTMGTNSRHLSIVMSRVKHGTPLTALDFIRRGFQRRPES